MTGYKRAWTLLAECMRQLNIPYQGTDSLPISVNTLIMFIGYLHYKGYAPASITSYVSAIGYVHKIKSISDPTTSFVAQRLLAATTKLNPTTDTRLPITLNILRQLLLALHNTALDPYVHTMIRAMFLVAFHGLMRIGELTSVASKQPALMADNLSFREQHAILSITAFKHNNTGRPFQIVLSKQSDPVLCPLLALTDYFKLRGNSPGPLFCFPSLQPVPRTFFTNKLNLVLNLCGLNHKLYKSHSFRIGAASFYASTGLSDEQIRLLGRWKSTAFRRYIRCQRIINALPS